MHVASSTIMVTGGSSGLGAACVRRFAAGGARVILADVNRTAGEQLAAELGDDVLFTPTDVTNESAIHQALKLAGQDPARPLRAVVNCAGILGAARVVGREGPHDLELFRRIIEVNLVGTFNVIRLAAAAMAGNEPDAEGERGVLVSTSSVAAFEGQLGQAAYSASKGGVASMMLPIARELGKQGIRCVAIAPGVFGTPMMEAMPDQVRESLESQVPFPPRLGRPDEYAAFAEHILTNVMLNGSVLRLDGAVRMAAR